MRVKKYKRVKKPKIHISLPGPEENDRAIETAGTLVRPERPEDQEPRPRSSGRGSETIDGDRPDQGRRGEHQVLVARENQRRPSGQVKLPLVDTITAGATLRDGGACDGRTDDVLSGPVDTAGSPTNTYADVRHDAASTPRTMACSETPSMTYSSEDPTRLHRSLMDAHTKSFGEDDDERYDDDDDASAGSSKESTARSSVGSDALTGRGSLWFTIERVIVSLQMLALALEVDGASWPPLFVDTWGWAWFANGYLRWPLLVLLRRVGDYFSLAFGEAQHELWFFRDVVGYGIEICAASVATFVLFFVLQMPDYTSHKPKAAWKRSFLTHWFRITLPCYVLNLALMYGLFLAMAYHGAGFFPTEVVEAITSVGGTLLTVSWLLVVLLSFAVHIHLRMATKHDGEYSFMIAMKHVVRIKGRICLLFLHLAYIPVTASIVRALIPMFDWNDAWATASRRRYNHHVWCYYLAFPPQVKGIEELIVLECTSTSGVAVHTLTACFFLLYTCGLPKMVRRDNNAFSLAHITERATWEMCKTGRSRQASLMYTICLRYLVRLLCTAFESNSDVIRSSLQAKEAHQATLEALASYPRDAVWLARRRREVLMARNVIRQARRRMWRVVQVSARRVPILRGLICTKARRRRKSEGLVTRARGNATTDGIEGHPGAVESERHPSGVTSADGVAGIVNGPAEQTLFADGCAYDATKTQSPAATSLTSCIVKPRRGSSRDGSGDTTRLTTGKRAPPAALLAAAAAQEEEDVGGRGRWKRKDELARRRRAAAGPSRLLIYIRERRKACAGLNQALATERGAYVNAGQEYVLALSDFEADHSLEITCWESVVDTSGLVYLIESYSWLHTEWKVVESLERGTFVVLILVSQQFGPSSTQLLTGALVLVVFQAWTLRAEPFLFRCEASLDSGVRIFLILALCTGAVISSELVKSSVADTFLLAVGCALIVAVLIWGDKISAIVKAVEHTLALADEKVNDFLFRQVRRRSLGLECPHVGIQLLMQWDDLLEQQLWSAFLAWPTPRPTAILTRHEKFLVVRWAALRRIDVCRARTTTGLSLLHDAIINAEVEPARWLVHSYPALLVSETLHKESPLLLGMLETARVLLRMEVLAARLENWDLGTFDSVSQAGVTAGLAGLVGGPGTAGQRDRTLDEDELAGLSWKLGKLMEIFLCAELQAAEVRWNYHQYDLLTEHGEPDLAELAQHLAAAFNLKPPKGYDVMHRWRKRAPLTRDCLGEALCASRTEVLLSNSGLGDIGYKSLLSTCRALSIPATTFTWPSPYTVRFPINVVRLDLSGNRLRRKSGYRVADMLLLNKTVEDLDLSANALDSQAAREIFYATRKNQVLKKLNLAGNKLGPEVCDALASMVTKTCSLTHLDLSNNQMGERRFWKSSSEFVCVPSAGPLLGDSLRLNKTLTVLKLGGNLMGDPTGQAFANGVWRHRSLIELDLSANLLLPEGGKALAVRLNHPAKSSLTGMNLADNHLGKKAGKLFASMLKRNRRLLELDLSRNELGTEAGIAFATALRVNKTLQSLALAGNGIGSNAAKNLAQTLAQNVSLRVLDLSANALGTATAEGGDPAGLGKALGHGFHSNSSLASLDLSGNSLPTMEMQHVADGLGQHASLSRLTLAGETQNDSAAFSIGRLASAGRLESLDLSRSALAGAAAVSVTRALSAANKLTHLDLSDNSLGGTTAQEIANALSGGVGGRGCPVLRYVSLARCDLGPESGACVIRALGCNRSVEELDLSDNGLEAIAGAELAKSLRILYRNGREVRPCRIRRLDVSRNPLGNKAGVAILGALINEHTQHLDFSFTELRGRAPGRAIGRMLRCYTIALQHLNVEHNALGREGMNEIFWAVRRNTSLLHLDVSDNGAGQVLGTKADNLEEYGTNSINSALSLNQTLSFVDLGTNGLSAECGMTIMSSIRKNRSLAKLSLENNLLDDQAASTVARKLRRDHQIVHLNLNNNRIGWEGALDLAAALALNTCLTYFDLGNNMLGEGGTFAAIGNKFGDALVRNKTLAALNLEGNRLGPSSGVAVAEALHRNNSLTSLRLENNRFDQNVGFALEDLLKVNFSLRTVGASVAEIGIDSRATIDDMLTAREKLLETHGAPANFAFTTSVSSPAGRTGGSFASNASLAESGSDSDGSVLRGVPSRSAAEKGRGRPRSTRALRARQASSTRRSSSQASRC